MSLVRDLRSRALSGGGALLTVLALVLALLISAVLIVFSDPDVLEALPYFFAYPPDTFAAMWESVSSAYWALFTGSIVDPGAQSVRGFFAPLSETLVNATPLIAAGLAFGLPFRTGLFYIGGEGAIVLGAICAGYVGFAWDLPIVIHLLVAVAAGLLGGAVWGGIPGLLKARTGAHEVITTIMLNYVALYLIAYLLTTSAFQRPGRSDPISPVIDASAQMPALVPGLRVHVGLVFVLIAAGVVSWLLTRSTLGFRLRAVGSNPDAARNAGMGVGRSYVEVMLIAGALAGLAGAVEALGTQRTLTGGISAGLGFDAITVALLGRSRPLGTVLAGLLFGALRAGGIDMQAETGTPVDIILVVQSLVVLFIAAPPLVKSVFRVRAVEADGLAPATKGSSL
ncbi:MAG TPA: ABC transporter permease [Nocardioidaceae bacterium]|nr:ABC transporter permease [Nocardioidaceae bacterium]